MNKMDKLIVAVLGLALAGWFWYSMDAQKKAARAASQRSIDARQAEVQKVAPAAPAAVQPVAAPAASAPAPVPTVTRAPAQKIHLTNDQVCVTFSSQGAAVTQVRLLQYAERAGALSESNPAVELDFSAQPALALSGVPGLAADADYAVAEQRADRVVFTNAFLRREVTLRPDYQLAVTETFAPGCPRTVQTSLAVGVMTLGASKNDILSVDSWLVSDAKGKSRVEHHGETDPLKSYLVGSDFGGCGGKRSAAGMPAVSTVTVPGARSWLAVKNRFFVAALTGLTGETGFTATVARDMTRAEYAPKAVSVALGSQSLPETRTYTLYLGPKKQELLWGLGLKDVMEFGMWRWVCYPMVWVLNVFNGWIPNYGVAIILLTLLVRLVFWPLTHKSTVGMRKMQEIQPKMKALQAKFKDNPQRLQQETWQLYRDHKVNPMSSCLPMLVQIPVFIALFTVLRSAVELRYAPFLWIADLSEPENLFPGIFPFGGLNILPVLMAVTMALQSALTPSAGDKNQQRMMIVMMPVMMLVMFYNFPSALSLYWTLSQVLSIVQMWWIRKRYSAPAAATGAVDPDAIDMPQSRQMRRHHADR